jgi:hypothetical protein
MPGTEPLLFPAFSGGWSLPLIVCQKLLIRHEMSKVQSMVVIAGGKTTSPVARLKSLV